MNKNKSILIVEDSDFDRALLVKALSKKEGYTTIESRSGEHCLEIVNTMPIDLILLDVMMPGIFGTEVLRTIRCKFNPITLPIIMITAKMDTQDIVSALQLGANDYITKPINFEVALSRINTHLSLSEASREMSRLKEIEAISSMVATYNHEINNPLSIALMSLSMLTTEKNNEESLKKITNALHRVADIVKKIKELSDTTDIQYASYGSGISSKIIKIK